MKKFFWLIFSVFTMIFNLICFWFSDILLNRYFVFGIIPLALCIIMLVVGLIVSVIRIFRDKKDIKNYFSFAVFAVTVVIIIFFPFRTARINIEMMLYEDERLNIIEMVSNGDIDVSDSSDVQLPKEYSHVSSDGHIYVYQNDEEQVVCFWVLRGMMSGSIQLIYSSQDEELIYKNETGHPITNVKKLKEHWYLVETDY